MRHPQHDAVARRTHDWYHAPGDRMGYRIEKRRFGVYWSTRTVCTFGFPSDELDAFLDDVRDYFGPGEVMIQLHDERAVAALGPGLAAAGLAARVPELYLAHVGPPPPVEGGAGAELEPVTPANLAEAAETRLLGFANDDAWRDPDRLQYEIDERRGELGSWGFGTLARVKGEPAAVLFGYDDAPDVLVALLATRVPHRGRGLAARLLARCVADAYAAGRRSVCINVLEENAPALRIYRRLGFVDEVFRRTAYRGHPSR